MMAARIEVPLIDRLPLVRGRTRTCVKLSELTWFRVGGPAEVVFRPEDTDDLCEFLKRRPAGVPCIAVGVGSNLLVRDGGVAGIVVRLGRGFAEAKVDGTRIVAGASALDGNVALLAAQSGLGGLEFLSGIPGTIGGGLRMNAGAYGSDMAKVVVSAEAVDGKGQHHHLTPADLGFTYRHASVPADWIFTGAVLQGEPADAAVIAERMRTIRESREGTQPVRSRTGGSTFKNPPGALKAWQLIDQAGCRGLARGGARVSALHCNFLINEGGATAADIEGLGEDVRARVRALSGIELDWEIERIGAPAGQGPAGCVPVS